MRNLLKKTSLVILFTQQTIQEHLQYRLGLFTWAINGAISPFLLMGVWLVVGSHSSLSMSRNDIVLYYLFAIIVDRFTQVWTIEQVGRDITKGLFSFKFLKPYSYLLEDLGSDLGRKIIRLATLIPIMAVISCVLVLIFHVKFDLFSPILVMFSLVLGFAIRFYLANLLALFVFWLEEYYSIMTLHDLIMDAFSGFLLPLALLPIFVRDFLRFTPFRYYISFPIELALNQINTSQIVVGFATGILMLAGLYLLYNLVFRNSVKRFTAYGQ